MWWLILENSRIDKRMNKIEIAYLFLIEEMYIGEASAHFVLPSVSHTASIMRSCSSSVSGSNICRSVSAQIMAVLTKVWTSVGVFVPAIASITCSHNARSTTMQMIKSRSISPYETCFTPCEIRSLNSRKYPQASEMLCCFNNSATLARRSNLPDKMCLLKEREFLSFIKTHNLSLAEKLTTPGSPIQY